MECCAGLDMLQVVLHNSSVEAPKPLCVTVSTCASFDLMEGALLRGSVVHNVMAAVNASATTNGDFWPCWKLIMRARLRTEDVLLIEQLVQ